MNWPPLEVRSSQVLAEVLRSAVHTKQKDLFEHIAQALQEQSGLDPAEFEHFFEECKRKPMTYILEDRCPAGQDPMSWVPMRFNDDTILLTLKDRLHEITSEILSHIPIEDMKAYFDGLCTAVPELLYLRERPSEPVTSQRSFAGAELAAFQTMRSVYLLFTGSEPPVLDDEAVEFSFLCESIVTDTRTQLKGYSVDVSGVETLIVLFTLRALGSYEPFQKRFGGCHKDCDKAALHAIEHQGSSLPSFHRLAETQQALIKGCLEAWFPLEMLLSTEVAPGHFMNAKDLLGPIEGGISFFICALSVDHVVCMRNSVLPDEAVDLIRLSSHSLLSLDKYTAGRCYEMVLKKRGERHSWRIVRDDLFLKAIVRICCFIGREDTDFWNEVQNSCEELESKEKEVLKKELASKDGCAETPAYILPGASRFMDAASSNPAVGLGPAITLLARVLEDAARNFDKMPSHHKRMVYLDIGGIARWAREYCGGGVPFEDTPFQLREDVGSGLVAIEIAGAPS